MSKCAICGGSYNWGFGAYKQHCIVAHGPIVLPTLENDARAIPESFKKIRPLNTSGRTKLEIVTEWEYANYSKLVH